MSRPAAVIEVYSGVARIVYSEGVEVVIVDWDNYETGIYAHTLSDIQARLDELGALPQHARAHRAVMQTISELKDISLNGVG